ncbi:CHAT domain-containing protein [Runella aurantiaca]|uniref:CHAT domain-containing protein n=1 Tax=Runella aurantiaca TaxID=2282308 RepID=A0A369I7T8_9BACT|nr:CHAT domain-containing protein [Runella aurantiaca]
MYDEYQTICQQQQVAEENIQRGLAEMLDTVGTITFFDRPFGDKYYILNPDWLTTGAYQIILSNHTNQKRGRINAQDLKIIFTERLLFEYKPSDYQFLLDVMAEFNLCHEFNKHEWLIPSSLEGQSKTDLVAFKAQDYRLYCLKYTTSLPSSVIHRFIARNVKHAYEEDYWRNGIVVKHPDSDTLMFVEADAKDKEIRLWIKGERIRDCWEFFHKDFKDFSEKFDYEQLVMLPQGDNISYQFLIEAWESGEESVFISKKTGKVNVIEALGLFEIPQYKGGIHRKDSEHIAPIFKKTPITLMAFASNGLAEIQTEANNVYKAISKSVLVTAQKIEDTTVENLADAMLDYGEELLLFHFGGHSEQSHVVLEGLQKMDKIRFSRLLIPDDKHPVPIVFLNGCLSSGHVGILTAKGVKAIIATNAKVNDVEAARLANYFYRWFFEKNATLRKAFENAEATVSSNSDSSNRGLGTDRTATNGHNSFIVTVNPGEIDDKQSMPASWTLFVHSGHTKMLDWTLQDFVNEFNK